MSDETLGPSDNQNLASGAKSLLGEPHTLAKANAVWYDTPTSKQRSLLASGCLRGTIGGDLTAITMHSHADEEFVDWLQGYAQFNAYIAPGSVRGQSTSYSDAMADKKTHLVNTVKMTITIY